MDDNTTEALARQCPTCGASMPRDARFCGACGSESRPTAAPAAPAAAEQAPVAAAAQPVAPVAPIVGDARVCPWCDARNPLDAARCVACGAVFPTPEGDAALERAAQARIQSMEADLRPVQRGWWPFRSRGPASQ
jgi:hypothetical protein